MVVFSSYWWSEANTHKGPSYKSLFLHKAPSVTSTPHSLSLFHQEDITEKYQFCDFNGSIYWRVCSTISFTWSSEMQFRVICLETRGGTQPYVAFSILDIYIYFLSRIHMALNSLTLHKPVFVVPCVLVGWWMGLSSCSLRSRHPSCHWY